MVDNETDKKEEKKVFLSLSGSSNIYSITLLSFPSCTVNTQKLLTTCLQLRLRLNCLDLKSQPEDNHGDISEYFRKSI